VRSFVVVPHASPDHRRTGVPSEARSGTQPGSGVSTAGKVRGVVFVAPPASVAAAPRRTLPEPCTSEAMSGWPKLGPSRRRTDTGALSSLRVEAQRPGSSPQRLVAFRWPRQPGEKARGLGAPGGQRTQERPARSRTYRECSGLSGLARFPGKGRTAPLGVRKKTFPSRQGAGPWTFRGPRRSG